jgi:hypothetical protein
MAKTALDLISSSLRLIGILAAGESPDLATANDSLSVLADMIDSWNADRLAIFTTTSDDFPFVIGQQTYTLGTGGNFDMARPAQIDAMSVILTSNPSNPIEVPIVMYSVDDWQNKVPVKSVTGSFPLVCYDTGDFPLRSLNFWPIPSQANNLRIYSWQPLDTPAELTTTIAFPPGYSEAFRYNLAVRLSAEFGAQVSPVVAQIAVESLARVKNINAPSLELQSDLCTAGNVNGAAIMFGLPYRGPIN